MRLTRPPETEEAPGQFWKDFIRDTAPVFRKSTTEQLAEFIAPTFEALVDGARYVDDRLREIIEELQPDLVVEDNVVSFPALLASGRRWARIASCNPAEMKDAEVPPVFSGLPSGERGGWEDRPGLGAAAGAGRARGTAGPSQPRLARLRRRRADAEACRRAQAPFRIVVSKGPQHTEFELADNMAGEEFLPQTEVLPKIDLVSPTAATTRSPSRCTSASRWWCCRSSGTSTTTPSGSTRPASASASTPTATAAGS